MKLVRVSRPKAVPRKGKTGARKARPRATKTVPTPTRQRAREGGSGKQSAAAEKKPAGRKPSLLVELVLANAAAIAERAATKNTSARRGEWRKGFLETLARNGGYIRTACREIGINRTTVYEAMAADPAFKAAVEEAQADALEAAEEALYIRGRHGVEKPVWWQGLHVGNELEYSDGCLTKYLESKLPTVYGRRAFLSNPDGSAFSITIKRASEERGATK